MRWIGLLVVMLWAPPASAQSVEMGAEVFKRCAICHEIGTGAVNRQGPQLNDLLGRRAGALPDFGYSEALRDAGESGLIWTPETLAEFIARPRHFEPGSRMIFRGLRNPAEIADVVAYLASLQTPPQVAIRTGRALVETYCGACHATGSEDVSAHTEAPAFRDLHHRYDMADLAEALVEGLSSGHPDMPEFEFGPDQAEAIIAYLKSLE